MHTFPYNQAIHSMRAYLSALGVSRSDTINSRDIGQRQLGRQLYIQSRTNCIELFGSETQTHQDSGKNKILIFHQLRGNRQGYVIAATG